MMPFIQKINDNHYDAHCPGCDAETTGKTERDALDNLVQVCVCHEVNGTFDLGNYLE